VLARVQGAAAQRHGGDLGGGWVRTNQAEWSKEASAASSSAATSFRVGAMASGSPA
jgi:hypothetical protein